LDVRPHSLVLAAVALLSSAARPAFAYSILTHEAVIDRAWDDALRPALLARYPGLTEEDLLSARAHAYGGALIQDLGYYPFSNHLFTDLTHYVRSGAFVKALLEEADDADGYAFALGALAHYVSDTIGHPRAVNLAVPMYSPKLKRKYGSSVTYEQGPRHHIRAEFGFDVAEVVLGRFESSRYHDFVGFQVARPVLERAFARTYGIALPTLLGDEERAINTYRHTASKLFPRLTEVAWLTKKDEILRLAPEMKRESFLYRPGRGEYEREFGADYVRPSIFKRLLAFLYRLIPKVGPLKSLAFKPATPETQALLERSLDETVARYRHLVHRAASLGLSLEDLDLDTGRSVRWGESRITALTYASLLQTLSKTGFRDVPPGLRADVLAYFAGSDGTPPPRIKPKHWQQTLARLEELKQAEAATVSGP
jgi:Zinc dependent phospholipase C